MYIHTSLPAVALLLDGGFITCCQTHSCLWIGHVSKGCLIERNGERSVGNSRSPEEAWTSKPLETQEAGASGWFILLGVWFLVSAQVVVSQVLGSSPVAWASGSALSGDSA